MGQPNKAEIKDLSPGSVVWIRISGEAKPVKITNVKVTNVRAYWVDEAGNKGSTPLHGIYKIIKAPQ